MRERALPLTLPAAMTDLMDIVGARVVWAIVRARGGSRVYVPKKPVADDHWLTLLLGRESADRLVDMCGGETIEVPRAASGFREILEAEIMAESDAGSSVSQLARRYQYTERGMRKLLGRVRRDAAHVR